MKKIIFLLFTILFLLFTPLEIKHHRCLTVAFANPSLTGFTTYTLGQEEVIEYTAQNMRDPFSSVLPEEPLEKPLKKIPLAEAEIPLPILEIEGLVWGTPCPQVIINGNVLKIGDTIEGAKILHISKGGIEILYEGEIFSLPSPGRKSLEQKEKKW